MRKFMKYEIKGSYKFVLGIIAVLLVASTIIQYNIYREINIGSPFWWGRSFRVTYGVGFYISYFRSLFSCIFAYRWSI